MATHAARLNALMMIICTHIRFRKLVTLSTSNTLDYQSLSDNLKRPFWRLGIVNGNPACDP